MLKITARVLGIVIGVLALGSSFFEFRFAGITNADPAIDLLRIIVAAALLFVGFVTVPYAAVRAVMITVGILYVFMGALAISQPTFFELLPSGFTDFDIPFHIAVGALAFLVGILPTLPRKADRETGGV